ncbi:hypothetical protein MLD38_020201 [Melastoma candidum]|uniref:Uncharacterized protein n=1 Tax=Melastoma candidum TaxID=119954 RepID=A0ACB9QE17_9MYRT|nr:hypothetical protein MLD38_020201 [Melastoma candidum]
MRQRVIVQARSYNAAISMKLPPANVAAVKPLPFPLTTLPSTPPTTLANLHNYLATNLPNPVTPSSFLRFLTAKLRHHPSFSAHSFPIFTSFLASSPSLFSSPFPTHPFFLFFSRTQPSPHLLPFLSFVSSNPCPCTPSIFSCPHTELVFRISIASLCRAGNFDSAIAAFDLMRKSIDGKPLVETWNVLIHGLVKHGMHERAFEIYDGMVRKDRVRPNAVTYNVLIDSYCRRTMIDDAVRVFRDMQGMGCKPDIVSFNSLIRGLLRAGKLEEGVQVAHELVEDAKCGISRATCEILVDGLCREGKAGEACDLVRKLMKKRAVPEDYDCLRIVEVLCRRGESGKAVEIVEEFWRGGKPPSLITCITLIEGLRKEKKLEQGLSIVKRMIQDGDMIPDLFTFNCLVGDLCEVGKTVMANDLRLLAQRKGLLPDGETYRILISGFVRERKREEGKLVLHEMLDMGFIPTIAAYNGLMDALDHAAGSSRKVKVK